jgi:hypothetical protein
MSGRECGNWINAYMEYTKESESPDAYHIWVALSSIASVARRNVMLDQGIYLLFPNLYIALVGPPARTAKSTAIRMGRRLITQVPGIKLGPDACSREQLIRAMAESKMDNQCCLTIHSTEFSSIIDTSGILMVQFLTDIYDCDYHNPSGWRYETKTSGKDNIVNPFLNMLVGTTPSYIADSMPDNVIGHGFTSRTIFIYGDKERHENPRPKEASKALMKALVTDLHTMANLRGEFTWDCDEAEHDAKTHQERHVTCGLKAYEDFYHKLFQTIPADHRLEGYHWRKKIHVLKVAMILCMAEKDELVLDAKMLKAADQFLELIEEPMARTFSAVGKYERASDMERIGSQVMAAGSNGLPVSEVFRRNYFTGSEQDIRMMIAGLTSMGALKLVRKNGDEWLIPNKVDLPWR